jgi:hypothetical protein
MLNVGSSANFLGKISESGCGTEDEHKNVQYTQSQSCVCSHNLQVFNNYSWLNLGADSLEDVFVTGNKSTPAAQRNLMRFMEPKYCQAPARSYATACSGAGCVNLMQGQAGENMSAVLFSHPERCTNVVKVEDPACVANPASCCTDDDAAVNGILLGFGFIDQDLIDTGYVITCSDVCDSPDKCANTCLDPQLTKLAGACGLTCALKGHAPPCALTAPNVTQGILGRIGEFSVCYSSEDSANFDQEKFEDRFPSLEERRCCSPSEFLFTGALWNEKKKIYEFFMLACQIIIALNNVLMAILGLCYWADWKKSSKFVFFAWIFPFVLKVPHIPIYNSTPLPLTFHPPHHPLHSPPSTHPPRTLLHSSSSSFSYPSPPTKRRRLTPLVLRT